ncbi:MAG: head GIN domain-containing protein [Bacteroidota bacterium]
MKKLMAVVLILTTGFFARAQKTIVNDANAEKREVSGFTGIEVSGGIDIYLSQGNEDGIAVSATEKKYRDRIRTELKNGVLKIWFERDGINWSGNRKLRVYISFKDINLLHASGSSDVYITGILKAGNLSVTLSGSSDLKGVVDIENLRTHISGASDITLNGRCGSLNIDASGSSNFKDYGLVVQTCEAQASGSSDVQVTVEKELNGSASGSSDIRIRGNGVIRKMHTSGNSSIKKA